MSPARALPEGPRALVRRVSPLLAQGIVTHLERQPVDVGLAGEQWNGYGRALSEAGWGLVEVPPAPTCPDSVFVEDTVVMFGGTAVITNPGAAVRRPELADTADTLSELGYPIRKMTTGALDGGDVLKVGRRIYVGRGGRTDPAGIAEFRGIVEELGGRVLAVPVQKVLHLKSAVTALPDGSIIGYLPFVDDATFFPHFRPMPEPAGSHVVDLGGDRLLIAASAPRSAELLAGLGYAPVIVDISEFEKLEGCVTCLSVRLRPEQSMPRVA